MRAGMRSWQSGRRYSSKVRSHRHRAATLALRSLYKDPVAWAPNVASEKLRCGFLTVTELKQGSSGPCGGAQGALVFE